MDGAAENRGLRFYAAMTVVDTEFDSRAVVLVVLFSAMAKIAGVTTTLPTNNYLYRALYSGKSCVYSNRHIEISALVFLKFSLLNEQKAK